ncbi:MAG: S46 family peptidase [Bacteroidales bacterium]
MKKIKSITIACIFLITSSITRADEGMWLLTLLEGYTIEDMQSKGFRLTTDDIYSVNEACLKDAVVIFGGGCTGAMISGDGLLITNHHCGYGAIQKLSSVENDYLTDGFWAMGREEELPSPGSSVRFLRYMKEVTGEVTANPGGDTANNGSYAIIADNMKDIIRRANENGRYESVVQPMFHGNQYFLFVYERFSDVRLVGAPPGAIGNFGRDHDNWMWPRHNGDFAIYRVYANKENKPSKYSAGNIPYKPRNFFEISMNGVAKNDFTMILGFPGSTNQFLYSQGLKIMAEVSMPMKVSLRTERLEIMDRYMKQSDEVRIQYASKYRGISNAWKKWQGAVKGLERLDAVERKKKQEAEFEEWVTGTAERREKYGNLMQNFKEIYSELEEYQVINDLMREAVFVTELMTIAGRVQAQIDKSVPAEEILHTAQQFYKDYYNPIDQETFAVMMENYRESSREIYHPDFFKEVDRKFKGDFHAYSEHLFSKTLFRTEETLEEFLKVYSKKPEKAVRILENDPIVSAVTQFNYIYGTLVRPQAGLLNSSLDILYKAWVRAIMEMKPGARHYPDANFTMRLTYGKVEGYVPHDGVNYQHYTTIDGIIEKSREGKDDYVIPEKLAEFYASKDYGEYGSDGTLPVCFTASNHTSGGNSGSPVLDGNGRLIGLNFDRNWHGTMSDEMYDPDMCRNIAVDMRYILFIIDKYAGAGYLLDEMKLVRD